MSCPYRKDSEIIEKYLLNQLPEEEKSEFENHLKSCNICQEQIQRDRIIVESIQKIGKEELKADLQQQLRESDKVNAGFNWGMILRAAAVLLFFVLTPGIIYYYQEIMPRQATPSDKPTIDEDLSIEPEAGGEITALQEKSRSNEGFARDDETTSKKQKLPAVAPIKKREGDAGRASVAASAERQKEVAAEEMFETESKLDMVRGADLANGARGEPSEVKSEIGKYRYEKNLQSTAPASVSKTEDLLGEQRILSRRSSVDTAIWQFSSDGQIVTVRPVQSQDVLKDGKMLPDSFAVNILRQDSMQLDMEWIIPQMMLDLNPEAIEVGIINKNQLNVFIDSQLIFEMDLMKDSTYAKQIPTQLK
jgi:hypothetical protein